ncbi:reverse transcriptase domain-containing protein [Tanacetum coccineum]
MNRSTYGRSYGHQAKRGVRDIMPHPPPLNLCGEPHPGKACLRLPIMLALHVDRFGIWHKIVKQRITTTMEMEQKTSSTIGRVYCIDYRIRQQSLRIKNQANLGSSPVYKANSVSQSPLKQSSLTCEMVQFAFRCMSTRSSTRNLIPPLENPERTIRRTRVDPTPLNDFEEINMAANGAGNDGPPPAGGGGLPVLTSERWRSDDANKHLDKFLHVTQSIKVNGVTDDALRLYLFPHSLTHHATAWFDRLPRNSITTFEQMAKMFLGKYFPPSMVTKLRNEITNFRQRPDESLFEAWERYKLSIDRCPNHNMLPITQIDTFCNGLTLRHCDTINAAAGGTFMKRRPEECYDLIENMTAHHNDWDTSAQRSESSSFITSSSNPKIVALKAEMAEINKNLMKMLQTNQQGKAVTPSCETCGGPHAYNDCPATVGQTQNVYAAGAYNQGGNSYQPQRNRNLLSYRSNNYLGPPGFNQNQNRSNENQNYQNRNQGNNHQGNNQGRNQFFRGAIHVQNPPPAYQAQAHQALGYQAPVHQAPIPQPQVVTTTKFTNYMKANDAILKNMQTNMTSLTNPMETLLEDLKGITTRSGVAYKGPTIPTTFSSPKVVERETEVTKDTVPPTNNGSTKDVQPPVVQVETQVPNSEPVVAPVVEPVEAPVSTLKPNPKSSIPYPSRLNDQKHAKRLINHMEKIFQNLPRFAISKLACGALISCLSLPRPL